MATWSREMSDSAPPAGEGELPTETASDLGGVAVTSEIDDSLLQRDVRARIFGTQSVVRVGRYELLRRIGSGGMGVVYAARDPELDREIALKLVLPGHERGTERMAREAKALAKLAHPNVVAIHEVGTHGDRVFVAMELAEGTTLRQWLESSRSLADIAAVFAQAGEGLAAAHRAGLVHRDFKPENVIIGDDPRGARSFGRVRVVDFGLARPATAISDGASIDAVEATAVTLTGTIGGTPAYMSLEQIAGGELDARADVFAFCVALYEAMHGRRPYAATSRSGLVLALERGPEGLAWRSDLKRPLVALVQHGLAPHAADRLASLDPILAELRRAESPPRRGSLALRVGVATLGIAAGVGFYAVRRESTEVAPTQAASVRAEDHLCPADAEPDPRSCAELETHLVQRGHWDDWEARCAYRRACSTPDPQCPEGTQWNGTVGCSLPACAAASDEEAMAACEGGDTACCVRSSFVRYEVGEDSDAAGKARIVEELSRACSAGDAHGCTSLATVSRKYGQDEASVLAALVTACGLGHAQACGRIAIPAEDREGLRPECTTQPDETCAAVPDDPVQLRHMAACRTAAFTMPGVLAGETRPLRETFDGLVDGEAAAIDRAEHRFAEELLPEFRALWTDAGGGPEGETLALSELAPRVQDLVSRRVDFAQHSIAIQKLADARAGILPARPATRASLIDRLFALLSSSQPRLDRALVEELGAERIAVLSQSRVVPTEQVLRLQGGCPD